MRPVLIFLPAEQLGAWFFRQARIKRFNPNNPPLSTLGLLFRLLSYSAPGITVSQFSQIFQRCWECNQFAPIDRLENHQCNGPLIEVDAQDENADIPILNSLLRNGCSGLTQEQIQSYFLSCTGCERIYFAPVQYRHQCENVH